MRYARLPSSYLRRTAATRLLAKAAVARAIEAVDAAVCNNPHPNLGGMYLEEIGDSGRRIVASSPGASRNANVWHHRVFAGTNDLRVVNASTISPDLVDYDTVTPLCMEALAYIPAPLVNEARAYSRVVPTAAWQSLGFDAGRFSYIALDVSDYLDINRLTADVPRSSSASGRISLAYMFENLAHTSSGAGAAQWDSFMEKFRKFDQDSLTLDFRGRYPLISVADFNLALGSGGQSGIRSPFCEYIQNAGGGGGFYGSSSEEDEDRIRRLVFVTDGFFPSDVVDFDRRASVATERYDLGDPANQPFPMSLLATKGGRRQGLATTLMGQGMNKGDKWRERIGRIGCAALYDYLDTDRVPCSLALPVTERVPMICGISPQFIGSKFALNKKQPEKGSYTGQDGASLQSQDANSFPPGYQQTVEATVRYAVDGAKFAAGFMGGSVKTLAVFPFARQDENDGSFEFDGRFALFFSTGDIPLRTKTIDDHLHLSNKTIPSASDTGEFSDKGLIAAKIAPQGFGQITKVSSEDDSLRLLESLGMSDGSRFAAYFNTEGNEFLRVTYRWTRTVKGSEVSGLMKTWDIETLEQAIAAGQAQIVKKESAFKMHDVNGKASDAFLQDIGKDTGPEVWLNAAVWLRETDGTDTVDMVPASIFDDTVQNGIGDAATIYQGLSSRLGYAHPLMKFETGIKFTLSIDELDSLSGGDGSDIKLSPATVLCADPRFNYAPESWFGSDQALTKQLWREKNNSSNGDGDIFLATSDAGYLQSKWELAHLPRFSPLGTFGGDATIGNLSQPPDNRKAFYTDFSETLNHGFAWRSYDPFDEDEDAFVALPWTNDGSGQRINPYSDSSDVLMAAFANTPLDWRRASTNSTNNAAPDFGSMSSAEFNRDYAFNQYCSDESARIRWETLEDVATRFSSLVRTEAAKDISPGALPPWEEAWQKMVWDDEENRLCTIQLEDTVKLWSADKKFLYGYWRDCFAAKQQLYLVFVRAEPIMLGGDVAGQVPPQLGARAMAVVWRDPSRTRQDDNIYRPHRTRVLFYRQFE